MFDIVPLFFWRKGAAFLEFFAAPSKLLFWPCLPTVYLLSVILTVAYYEYMGNGGICRGRGVHDIREWEFPRGRIFDGAGLEGPEKRQRGVLGNNVPTLAHPRNVLMRIKRRGGAWGSRVMGKQTFPRLRILGKF